MQASPSGHNIVRAFTAYSLWSVKGDSLFYRCGLYPAGGPTPARCSILRRPWLSQRRSGSRLWKDSVLEPDGKSKRIPSC